MKFDFYTFTISQHFSSALINGDYSGLTDNEVKDLDLFMDNLPISFIDFDCESEPFFAKCEICGLFSECLDFKLYFPLNEATA